MGNLTQGFKGDEYNPTPQHQNGSVASAGTPIVFNSPGGADDPITLLLVRNPSRGPNANTSANHVLLINIDGTTTKLSLNRGENIYIPGNFASFTIDASHNGVKFETVIWY